MLMALVNLIKGVVSLLILAIIGIAGFQGYEKFKHIFVGGEKLQQENQRLKNENQELFLDNERLALANRLLKVDYQLAYIRMKGTFRDRNDNNQLKTLVEFWEIDEDGSPISERVEFPVKGEIVHIEGWVAKFDDEYVEKGDPLRGAAMFAFKKIHGDEESPKDGFTLNSHRTQPSVYNRGGAPSAFEKNMWANFWNIANDPERMKQLGLRAVQGQGASMQLREGKIYLVKLRSTGDVTINVLPESHSVYRSPHIY